MAIEGGDPIRKEILPYGRQVIEEDDKQAVVKALEAPMITRAKEVRSFEEESAELCGAKYGVAFTSGTSALHAAMAIRGASAQKRAIVPAITFAATSNAALYCQAKLEFVDLKKETLTLDVECLPENLSDSDIVASVDFAGCPCDYDELHELAQMKGFRLIVDAAHSLGAFYKGRPVGTFSDLVCLSFHPVKTITCGEGGMVLCQSEDDFEALKEFRNHGIVGELRPGYSEMRSLGYNYHMNEMQGALGRSQLKKLKRFVEARSLIAKKYQSRFEGHEFFDLPVVPEDRQSAWHLFPIQLKLEKLRVTREQILAALRAENVWAQVHYIPVYWHPYYQRLGFKKGLCPVAERGYEREISLPIFPGMTDDDLADVSAALDKIFQYYRA